MAANGKGAARSRRSAPEKTDVRQGRPSLAEVTRYIPTIQQCMLWGRAAGRCEFAGCNKPLWKSSVTQEMVNIAQKAHIYSFSNSGPRGNAGLAAEEINDLANLILVCHECHRKIDREKDGRRYTADLLQKWKHEHERRVDIVTGIDTQRRSHVILYGANIGEQSSPLTFADAASALFPHRYPADDWAIELGMSNSVWKDRDEEFWRIEARQLLTRYRERVKERLATSETKHLSVFGLAPQPLLIQLGTLLTDIQDVDVYQFHREPKGWGWVDATEALNLQTITPKAVGGPPALIFSLSATVTADRIHRVIGDEATIWQVTVPKPHNDLIRSQDHLREFREFVRPLMDQIKAIHSETQTLHVFPAIPASAAIELGRIRMPKADLPWKLYDQVKERGGFVPALSIKEDSECVMI